MRNVLLTAVCVLALVGTSMAAPVTLTAGDMAGLMFGDPDGNYGVAAQATMCNYPVLIYRFDMTAAMAADGNVAADNGVFESNVQWTESLDWTFKAIGTSADFDSTAVTWNSYTGSAADMGYWDAMPVEDIQAYPEGGNFGAPGLWTISQAVVQGWADAGGIATLALVRNDTYYNACHWTTNGWDYGQLPKLTVEFIPEPATLSLVVLGGLAVLRRRR